jgi:hypothetical protein
LSDKIDTTTSDSPSAHWASAVDEAKAVKVKANQTLRASMGKGLG